MHLWHPTGDEPETIWQILNRQKDIQYSSRIASHIVRQRETHKLRHVITNLLEFVPEEEKNDPLYKELAGYRCDTRMHVVRLLSPKLSNETHTKDIDFTPAGISSRWEAGHADTRRALERQAWIGEWGLLDGVVLHEPRAGGGACGRDRAGEAIHHGHIIAKARGRMRRRAAMNACSGISAIQILLVAVTFLLAVLSLDVFWVRVPQELHDGDIAGALRKQSWLNAFVAIGRGGRRSPAACLGELLQRWRALARAVR